MKPDTSRAIVSSPCVHRSVLNPANEQSVSEVADTEFSSYSGGVKVDPLAVKAHQSNVGQVWMEKKEHMQLSLQPWR